jgi:methyl coenzyme M reductase alpha subunit
LPEQWIESHPGLVDTLYVLIWKNKTDSKGYLEQIDSGHIIGLSKPFQLTEGQTIAQLQTSTKSSLNHLQIVPNSCSLGLRFSST